ncbi:acetylxylan esterase [Sunxiuqinia sp. A32]|uniref:acetylxylan esterase n=1 Tax=Sunxiuqinia sp. A32 TaxID=3461496 RepID=UPI0040467D09
MKKSLHFYFSIFTFLFIQLTLIAQPARKAVNIRISPNHQDWTYQLGEPVVFEVDVYQFDTPIQEGEISYSFGLENMLPSEKGTKKIHGGGAKIKAPGLTQPGFLRCHVEITVDGKTYKEYATAGFLPEYIKPTTTLPGDFLNFWEDGKEKLAEIPVNPILTLMPDRCTSKANVYHVSIDNINGKIYGILCTPKKSGKYPAILHVPGAGIRPYYGDVSNAEKGIITFQIGIHGIQVNLNRVVYENLGAGALSGYSKFNLDDKDNCYYKRVYLGCVRSVDFIFGLDEFDGENIAVTGGSQGGALSIVTAGLDHRIKYLAADYPALCDLTGYLHGRTGGWPHLFKDGFTNKPEKVETSKYFDVVNFARFVEATGHYSWGFDDNVCPPTSMYAAYNLIKAPKELFIYQDTQHWTYPEQRNQKNDWLLEKLLPNN